MASAGCGARPVARSPAPARSTVSREPLPSVTITPGGPPGSCTSAVSARCSSPLLCSGGLSAAAGAAPRTRQTAATTGTARDGTGRILRLAEGSAARAAPVRRPAGGRRAGRAGSARGDDALAADVATRHEFVRLGELFERERLGDRDPQLAGVGHAGELLEVVAVGPPEPAPPPPAGDRGVPDAGGPRQNAAPLRGAGDRVPAGRGGGVPGPPR